MYNTGAKVEGKTYAIQGPHLSRKYVQYGAKVEMNNKCVAKYIQRGYENDCKPWT
jgi:hypothetical protein